MEEDLKNIEEFLSKRTLDEIDKFLFGKYIKSMEKVLNAYKQDKKMIDEMAEKLIGVPIYDENKETANVYFDKNQIKEYFGKLVK